MKRTFQFVVDSEVQKAPNGREYQIKWEVDCRKYNSIDVAIAKLAEVRKTYSRAVIYTTEFIETHGIAHLGNSPMTFTGCKGNGAVSDD
jgi:predicted secreted hydrolase